MPRHATVVRRFPLDALDYLLWYFHARTPAPGEPATVPMAEVGAGQADVVLALLRTEDASFIRCAEDLVGRKIGRCPPCLHLPRAQMEFADPTPAESRVFRKIVPNPRLPTTQAFYRYRVLREGMTFQQALVRGLKKRDVRLGLSRNWFTLEAPR